MAIGGLMAMVDGHQNNKLIQDLKTSSDFLRRYNLF